MSIRVVGTLIRPVDEQLRYTYFRMRFNASGFGSTPWQTVERFVTIQRIIELIVNHFPGHGIEILGLQRIRTEFVHHQQD